MVFKKKMDKEGQCPVGYEYVNSYSSNGVYHQAYCRKIPKFRHDPYEKQKNKELLDQQKFEDTLRDEIENGHNDLPGEESL